jgi:hypothetical protein
MPILPAFMSVFESFSTPSLLWPIFLYLTIQAECQNGKIVLEWFVHVLKKYKTMQCRGTGAILKHWRKLSDKKGLATLNISTAQGKEWACGGKKSGMQKKRFWRILLISRAQWGGNLSGWKEGGTLLCFTTVNVCLLFVCCVCFNQKC